MNPSKEELSALIERVRGLKGPDREVDEAVMALFYTREDRHIGAEEGDDFGGWEPVKDSVWVDPKTDRWVSTAAFYFTASNDAALALVERVRPGWFVMIDGRLGEEFSCELSDLSGRFLTSADQEFHARASTLPIAIILALLLSLQSQEPL